MYNVEKYVGCAIQSLLDQTFTDFEAILVDDCSTDNTLEIAKSFHDPRIKIIEGKKNVGLGMNRNRGIKAAQGKYIYFFDSDDALLPNALEMLVNAADESNADLVVSTVYLRSNDSEFQSIKDLSLTAVPAGMNGNVSKDLKTRIWEEYAMHKTHCAAWLGIYKKPVFTASLRSNGGGYCLAYRDFSVAEDDFFLFELLCKTSNIVKINSLFYIYRVRATSISNSADINKLKKFVPVFMEFAKNINKKLLSLTKDQYFADSVIQIVLGRLMNLFAVQFLISDRVIFFKILTEILTPTFKDNTSFVKVMFCSSMLGEVMASNLTRENEVLKNKIKEITSSK